MADQPCEEKAYVKIEGKQFRLLRCSLVGEQLHRNRSRCFQGNVYMTVHVDDVFVVGTPQILQEFVLFLKDKKKWKVEAKGPFAAGEKFLHHKRQLKIRGERCDIRRDRKQYYGLEKELDLFSKSYQKTPTRTSQRKTTHHHFTRGDRQVQKHCWAIDVYGQL